MYQVIYTSAPPLSPLTQSFLFAAFIHFSPGDEIDVSQTNEEPCHQKATAGLIGVIPQVLMTTLKHMSVTPVLIVKHLFV